MSLPLALVSLPALPANDVSRPRLSLVGAGDGLLLGCGDLVGNQQCSGHGTCAADSEHPDQGSCECTAPWKGRYCDVLECPTYRNVECGGVGKCGVQGDQATCTCDYGYAGVDCGLNVGCDPYATGLFCSGRGTCRGNSTCECTTGWSGQFCETDLQCPLDALGRPCSDGGYCVAHTCLCKEYRYGTACEDIDTQHIDHPDAPSVSNTTVNVTARSGIIVERRKRAALLFASQSQQAARPRRPVPGFPSNSWGADLASSIDQNKMLEVRSASRRSAQPMRGRSLQLLRTASASAVEAPAWPRDRMGRNV